MGTISAAEDAGLWKIRSFSVMAKPVGAACNLSCEYCYYRHKAQPGELGSTKIISDAVLERFIEQYIDSQDNPSVFFAWQGGEPALAGLDFYRKVVALQQKYAQRRPGTAIVNTFQTNGVLFDDAWCRFLAEHRFLVGISIDGPADLHDRFRHLVGMAGSSHTLVTETIARLKHYGIPFNALVTVHGGNAEHAGRIYDHLVCELGVQSLQFQPCVERKDFRTVAPGTWPAATLPVVGSPQAQPGHPDAVVTDWSVSAQQWGTFLCQLFDCWWDQGVGRVHINWFDSWARQWLGREPSMCLTSPVCGRCVALEADGQLYSCDHFVYSDYVIGNLNAVEGWPKLVRSSRQQRFGEAKGTLLPSSCRHCPFLFACYGECPKRRFLRTRAGEAGLNYLCGGYRAFFDHAGPRISEYAKRFAKPLLV